MKHQTKKEMIIFGRCFGRPLRTSKRGAEQLHALYTSGNVIGVMKHECLCRFLPCLFGAVIGVLIVSAVTRHQFFTWTNAYIIGSIMCINSCFRLCWVLMILAYYKNQPSESSSPAVAGVVNEAAEKAGQGRPTRNSWVPDAEDLKA